MENVFHYLIIKYFRLIYQFIKIKGILLECLF